MKARNRIEAALHPKIMAALEDPQLLEGETSGVARFVQAMRDENNRFVPKDNECAPSRALPVIYQTQHHCAWELCVHPEEWFCFDSLLPNALFCDCFVTSMEPS